MKLLVKVFLNGFVNPGQWVWSPLFLVFLSVIGLIISMQTVTSQWIDLEIWGVSVTYTEFQLRYLKFIDSNELNGVVKDERYSGL